MSKFKAHTIYKNKDGKRVPGTTTITGMLNKPALVRWANKMGLNGIDTSKFVDDKAAIGTLAHEMITNGLVNKPVDTGDYSKNQIEAAENSVLSFYNWEKEHKIEAMLRVFSDQVDKNTVLKLRMELDNLSFHKIHLTEKIKWFFFNLVKNQKVLLDGIRWVISRLFYREPLEKK